ncbi:MAG: hypothetical protein RLY70_2195, partial [Planctomycetota bacterium]
LAPHSPSRRRSFKSEIPPPKLGPSKSIEDDQRPNLVLVPLRACVPPCLRELIRPGLLCNAASRPLFVGKNGKSARETCQPLCDRTKREKCQPLFDPFFGQLVPGTFMCRAGRRTRCPSYMGRADVGLSRPAGRNGKSARHFSTFRSASDQVTPPNWLHAISPSTIAGVGLVRLDVTTKKRTRSRFRGEPRAGLWASVVSRSAIATRRMRKRNFVTAASELQRSRTAGR